MVLSRPCMRRLLLALSRFTMQPRFEGIKRIVLACSVVLVALWAIWALSTIVDRVLGGNELVYSLFITAASGIVLFSIPKVIPELLA